MFRLNPVMFLRVNSKPIQFLTHEETIPIYPAFVSTTQL